MKKGILAALIGVGAGAALFGAYYGALHFGIHIRPDLMLVGAAALAFASTVAVFALVSLDRPSGATAKTRLLLNELPATRFIFPFSGEGITQLQVRPEMSIAEVFARYDVFKKQPSEAPKDVVLTIKGSEKLSFSSVALDQILAALKPFNLQHVLLKGDRDEFIGYIPGKRAVKEFAGGNSADKITKYIVKVIDNPETSSVLREIDGATSDDTIKDTGDTFDAETMLWANEAVNGLVVLHHLKPAGYISRVDLLRIDALRHNTGRT